MTEGKEDNAAFELQQIRKPRDASHYTPSAYDGDPRNSSSTSNDEGDDWTEPGEIESFKLYTPDEERAVIKKLDRRLVLFIALLYMLSFLDRSSAF